ncbi:MAG TPA: hypothetical protein VHQ39_08470 [Dongiaceae bacterium]|jgi:hypothetical protein|nr:hypothetical protein [Dongiaceae bacterium]
MNAKVPVLGTLNEAVAMTVNHRRELLRVGLVFIIGFFALSIVFARYLWPLFSEAMMDSPATGAPAPVDPRLPSAMLLMYVIGILLISVFAVGWHRATLIGAERGQGAQLGKRELRYFGRFWLCIGISIAVLFFVAFVEELIGAALRANAQSMMFGAVFANLLVIAYVFARLGPTFVSLSVDRQMSFRESWIATKGNGVRILLIYMLAWLSGLVLNFLVGMLLNLLGLGELAPYTVVLIGALTLCALAAVIVSANTIIFRQLTGWKPA